MTENAYQRFKGNDLILRDELAIDRTILANERTILAYFRTSLTLMLVGVTFLHFIDKGLLPVLGIVLIPLGLAVGVFGFVRYRNMKRAISNVRSKMGEKTNKE